jgi:hypothetical protein
MRGGAFRIRRAGEHHACSRRHALSSQRGRSPGPVVAPCLVGLCLYASASLAGGIDHVVTFDDSGIWNRNVQKALVYTLVGGEIAGAVWLGGEDRLGKTFWSAIDSSELGAVSAHALKFIFTRARPSQDPDPNKWFPGFGSAGTGDFPRLAGQHAKYVIKQLNYIQSLVRTAPVMHGIVKDLTSDEIRAVAAYLQSK